MLTADLTQFYPGFNLDRFGLNPYSQPLYRVVFGPSRRSLVCGNWSDGTVSAKLLPKYNSVGDRWILEKWLSAEQFAGVSRIVWDAELAILGPWPERGEYEMVHAFEACGPVDANLDKLIAWIEAGRRSSFQDVKDACARNYAQEEKDSKNLQTDMIHHRLPAFGGAPLVGFGGGRGTKTGIIRRSAQDLNLPTTPNKFISA
jgi:hypothetical protein